MFDDHFWLDCGNSRCKWQWQGKNYVGSEQEMYDFASALPVASWLLSSVRPLTQPQVAGLPWRRARVMQQFDGFSLTYQPEALGLDRWLAMLAVRDQLQSQQVGIVVDMGTATTLDLFTRAGHMGGLIMPGFNTSKQALFSGTAQLRQAQFDGHLQPAHSTEKAIGRGYYWPIQALLQQWCQQYPGALLVCTGGDSGALMPLLPQAKWQANLVIDGLQWLHSQGGVA